MIEDTLIVAYMGWPIWVYAWRRHYTRGPW